MTAEPATVPVRATRREWMGLAVLALPTLLLALDLSVLFLALPHLSADLDPSSTQTLWIMDIYGFMIAGFLVTMGTLGDRFGRRRLLVIGASAFGVTSILAAYSASAEMLVVSRAVLGIAGATLMPSTLALISNMFRDPKQRGTAVAVWMSCFMAGMAVGPLVGGVLLEWFWWGSVFLMGVPVMALLLVSAPALLPEYRDPDAGRLDLTSVALSLAAILPMVFSFKELAKDGLGPVPLMALAGGLAFGVVFVRRQRRLADPLLDLRLFGNRSFTAALGVMLLGTFMMGGAFLFVTQYLQMVEGLSPLRAGLWLLLPTFAVMAGSLPAPRLAASIRPGYVIGAGLASAAVGFGLLTQLSSAPGMALLMPGFVLVALGMGPLGVLCTDLVLGSAPPEKAGSASAMSETSGEFGIAMGVAVLGSVGTAAYRQQMAGSVPGGVPADDAESARDTLANALTVAQELPAATGDALLAVARQAFATGLSTLAMVSGIMVVTLGGLAVLLLRHVRPSGGPAAPDPAVHGSAAHSPAAHDSAVPDHGAGAHGRDVADDPVPHAPAPGGH